MARNTGRGSMVAANSAASRRFIEAKRRGGAFGARPTRFGRHGGWFWLTVALLIAVVIVGSVLAAT